MSLKISEMSDGGGIQPTDQVPVVRGGLNYRAQVPSVPATTNDLSLSVNTLTSVVNGVSDTSPSVSAVVGSYSGTAVSMSVNGVSATPFNVQGDTFLGYDPVNSIATNTVSHNQALTNLFGTVYAPFSTYIVGTGAHAYATIQAAITQAVSDGASNSTPKLIFVQAGTYSTDFTLQAGIYLIAANGRTYTTEFSPSIPTPEVPAVKLVCKISYTGSANSVAKIKGFGITTPAGGIGCDSSTNSFLYFEDCIINTTDNAHIFLSPSSAGKFFFTNCSSIGLGNFFSILFASSQLKLYNCDINNTAAGTFSASAITCVTRNTQFNTGNLTVSSGSTFFDSSSSSYPTINVTGGSISGTFLGGVVSNIAADSPTSVSIVNAIITGTLSGTGSYQKFYCRELSRTPFIKELPGYYGSDYCFCQGGVQTTDATPTNIACDPIGTNESCTIIGNVVGSNTAHTDSVGGSFTATVQRAGGAISLVGVVVPTVYSSSTGTFTVSVDTTAQALVVQVAGVAATTMNWVTTFQYQRVLTNA